MARKLDGPPDPDAAGRSEKDERRRRLAAALRENLGRRKAQGRERRAREDGQGEGEGDEGAGREDAPAGPRDA